MLERQLAGKSKAVMLVPVILTLVIALYAMLSAQTIGGQPRDGLFDVFERLNPRPAASSNLDRFAIIDIDAESVERLGPWPWPRTALAKLADDAKKAKAKGVVISVPVDGADPLSPEIVGRYWLENGNSLEDNLASSIAALPSHDIALAAALRDIPAVIAVAPRPQSDWTSKSNLSRTIINNSNWLVSTNQTDAEMTMALWAIKPSGALDRTIEAVAQASILALPLDDDGVFRRMPPMWQAYDKALPSTALAAALLADARVLAIPHPTRTSAAGSPLQSIRINDTTLPLDATGSMRLYPPRNQNIAHIPAWRLLSSGQNWTGALSGKIVFIGESVTEGSLIKTPEGDFSRAATHVLLADQLLSGVVPVRPLWAGLAEAGMVILIGVLIVFAALLLRPAIVTSLVIASAVILLVANWLLFMGGTLLIDLLPAIAIAVLAPVSMVVTHFAMSIMRDDHLRGAFHGALPPKTMENLGAKNGLALLQGARRQVTVLSCGVRLPPEAMAQFVDRSGDFIHFIAQSNDKLRRTILEHGGTVDHGEDGRLLGYWNVPEENTHHIERACACALEMIDDMISLSQDVEMSVMAKGTKASVAHAESAFEQGYIEIGIASDICYSGPVGKGVRNRYSVIGEAVALSSHLRSRSRQYGPAIICDETVFMAMRHHYAFLDLDTLRVNDQPQLKPIYGLVGNPFLKASRAFRELAETQRALIIAWRSGEFNAVTAHLQQLRGLPGTNHFYIEMFEKRLEEARKKQSEGRREDDKQWDGATPVIL